MSGFYMLKLIQIFIICILIIEFFSFSLGYGTHFETYKFIILISVVIFNIILTLVKKNRLKNHVKNSIIPLKSYLATF